MSSLEKKIAVIGLGYVGLPLATELSLKYKVIGFDLNTLRINQLKKGVDRNLEVESSRLNKNFNLSFTDKIEKLRDANIYIVTVPTPIDKNNVPNLDPLISASKTVGEVVEKDNIVIFESTVFPGCTEEVCIPEIEKGSNLKYKVDFHCGYSPERINPGDKKNTLSSIVKITSGSSPEIADIIDDLYSSIIDAGTCKVSSIAVAEAAKVIENTQRDVNIALINEISIICEKLGIDTTEVLEAAGTKWNFLPFRPGLVGGHCIGVDPYYLTHKSIELGYMPEVILAGRRINDKMSEFIAEKTIMEIVKQGINPINSEITILGLTFKENCPDLRNTKVLDLYSYLINHRCKVQISDEWADDKDIERTFNIKPTNLDNVKNQDVIILAVGHEQYKKFRSFEWDNLLKGKGILIDIKSIYSNSTFSKTNRVYWRL